MLPCQGRERNRQKLSRQITPQSTLQSANASPCAYSFEIDSGAEVLHKLSRGARVAAPEALGTGWIETAHHSTHRSWFISKKKTRYCGPTLRQRRSASSSPQARKAVQTSPGRSHQ